MSQKNLSRPLDHTSGREAAVTIQEITKSLRFKPFLLEREECCANLIKCTVALGIKHHHSMERQCVFVGNLQVVGSLDLNVHNARLVAIEVRA